MTFRAMTDSSGGADRMRREAGCGWILQGWPVWVGRGEDTAREGGTSEEGGMLGKPGEGQIPGQEVASQSCLCHRGRGGALLRRTGCRFYAEEVTGSFEVGLNRKSEGRNLATSS